MTEPLHDLCHTLDLQPFGQCWPRDHDHGQAKRPGRVDLGACAIAAGIAGDDPCDAARAYHLQFAVESEWSTRDDHVSRKGQGCPGRVDETQRVGVLRLRRERRDVLAADGEEHVCRRLRQRGDRRIDVSDLDPVVAGCLAPRLAFERNQGRAGFRACGDRISAHLGSERMRRIDHMRDAFAANIIGQPAHAAKTADAGRQRLIGWRAGAAAIGVDGIDTRARDLRREQARIGSSAQNEGACRV